MANPYIDDIDDDEADQDQAQPENQNFKQLRAFARKLEREAKELREANEALRTQVTAAVFKEVGLSEKHAALFTKVGGGDISVEAVKAFAEEYELPVRSAAPAAPEAPAEGEIDWTKEQIVQTGPGPEHEVKPQSAGLPPVQGTGTAQGSIIDNVEDAQKLAVTNYDEYVRLREAGRIKLPSLPGSE